MYQTWCSHTSRKASISDFPFCWFGPIFCPRVCPTAQLLSAWKMFCQKNCNKLIKMVWHSRRTNFSHCLILTTFCICIFKLKFVQMHNKNTPGIAGGPDGRNWKLAVKSKKNARILPKQVFWSKAFFFGANFFPSKNDLRSKIFWDHFFSPMNF